MSLGQLSSRGKQNNKLYLITVKLDNGFQYISFSFYSSKKIDTKNKLIDFISEFFNSRTLNVFGGNYRYQEPSLKIPFGLRHNSGSTIILYFYNGSQWRNATFSTSNIEIITCEEM